MGMTMEGDVMGTPKYMSPEQAEGMVADLDERSDIYSLGGILYAILTLRSPIEGKTLDEVLTNVKNGRIRSMIAKRSGKDKVAVRGSAAMERHIPEALQAVTLKAMALNRSRRYASVEAFASDIEAYQNGFATKAENAGAIKRMKLWVVRNKVLAGSAVMMLMVVSGFSAQMVVEGRKASEALNQLRASAPVFAGRAEDQLRDGNVLGALKSATSAVNLEPENREYHRIRGNVFQLMVRWPEAVREYRLARGDEQADKNFKLTEELIRQAERAGDAYAKGLLFEELNRQGRQYEAMTLSSELGEFWKERERNVSLIPELVRRLEAKLLPLPGTKVMMCKTEFTVGEWKLYLRAEGLPEWTQPSKDFNQTDEHPVVSVSWNEATRMCEWLSRVTRKEWGLPTNAEWEAAVGKMEYPWGDYFPPKWDDGNYAILEGGKDDPQKVGLDGIKGTAPVGSFKPNLLGFYDLGGNVWEWMSDEIDAKTGNRSLRGSSWSGGSRNCRVSYRYSNAPDSPYWNYGFRLVRRSSGFVP